MHFTSAFSIQHFTSAFSIHLAQHTKHTYTPVSCVAKCKKKISIIYKKKMVKFPLTVEVKCMGEFNDTRYVGGKTKFVTIISDSVSNLRYHINHELPVDWISSYYEMYYLSKSLLLRTKKHLLQSDEDLLRLCSSQKHPVVYIDHDGLPATPVPCNVANEGTSASGPQSQVYIPSFEHPQFGGHGYGSQSSVVDEGLESIQRYGSLDWFGEANYGVENTIPNNPQSGGHSQPPVYSFEQPQEQCEPSRPSVYSYDQPQEQYEPSRQSVYSYDQPQEQYEPSRQSVYSYNQPQEQYEPSRPSVYSYNQPQEQYEPSRPSVYSFEQPQEQYEPARPSVYSYDQPQEQYEPSRRSVYSFEQPQEQYGHDNADVDWGTWEDAEATSGGKDCSNATEDTSEEDAEDPDYEVQTEDDVSEDMSEGEQITFTRCDFAAWVRREGGMGNVLSAINAREEEDEEVVPNPEELTNWLVPIIPLDPASSFADVEYDPSRLPDLAVKAEFESKDDFMIAVGMWNMKRGFEVYSKRSDKSYIVQLCKHSVDCPFDARASTQLGLVWTCYKFIGEHTCTMVVHRVLKIKASANVVAAYVAERLYDDCDLIRPKTIRLDLQREFGVKINYGVALSARNLAIEMVYGGHAKSYQLLPSYLYMLKRSNSGSIVDWEVDADGRFKHCFVALGATRTSFLWSMRPVVVIDGTHLKGKGKGVLFIAATKDGNEQLYPLAYGVGPKENDESWKWFCSRFKTAYGDAKPLLVVSDAHVSIANAVHEKLDHATHALCYYHLQKKMRLISNEVWKTFRKAAYTYNPSDQEELMRKIKSVSPAAHEKLKNIGEKKWARSKCPVNRYSFMTSNAAESFNSRLMWARRLPICSLLEAIRIVIEQWWSERREAAEAGSGSLSPAAHERLAGEIVKSRRYSVTPVRPHVYKVKAQNNRFTVDLNNKECECGVFQIDDLPCSHAIAAIGAAGRSIEEYLGVYYTRQSLVDVYSGQINHLPPRHHWTVPEHISDLVVLPPPVIRQAGRPKQTRARGAGESARPSTRAHPNTASSSGARRRARKTCSICGDPKHTRRKCPRRFDEF